MLSVTKRIRNISQPNNGYVPKNLFTVKEYDDYYEVQNIKPALAAIQGLAVDYLTRFILSGDKNKAFDISIKGAKRLDEIYAKDIEYKKILKLLNEVTGLDRKSIINTCKIVSYDSACRADIKSYQSSDNIEFDEILFSNVSILVRRCLAFLIEVGPVISNGFTFEGGYTQLVSSGDGDYLTKDTLIDIKVSKKEQFSNKWSLQLLMYYLLGIHSIHTEFMNIDKLCIFNPYKNQSYICNIADISDESKYKVSCDVLGYKMAVSCNQRDKQFNEYKDYSTWRQVIGSDDEAIEKFLTYNFSQTNFKIENYTDGIFDISVEDYWTYLLTTFKDASLRPIFKNTKSVKLIKHNGYYMFISVSPKEKYSLLHGARLHNIEHSLEYYYKNIERYALAVINQFSRYWDVLRKISRQVQQLEPTEKHLKKKYSEYLRDEGTIGCSKDSYLSYNEWYKNEGEKYKLSGRIHGCIIDIDTWNHIYVNPYDGKIVPYNAVSKFDKKVYKNMQSLLLAQRPEILPAFSNLLESNKKNKAFLIQDKKEINSLFISKDNTISKKYEMVYEYDMYKISDMLKPLQNIYDIKLVQIWYDEILTKNKILLDDKYYMKSKQSNKKQNYIGQAKVQKNGMPAIVIRYGGCKDVDIRFEDGTIVEHISIAKWRNGTIKHPDTIKKYSEKSSIQRKPIKNKYIGLTKKMNCGLSATIIDYKNCKNVTIQFEDGLVKSGVRSDHFMEGKVRHI